jgi:hypothetical protein
MAADTGGDHEVIGRVRLGQRHGTGFYPVLLKQHVWSRSRWRRGWRAAQFSWSQALQDVRREQRLHVRRRHFRQKREECLRASMRVSNRFAGFVLRGPCCPQLLPHHVKFLHNYVMLALMGCSGRMLNPLGLSVEAARIRGTHHGESIKQSTLHAIHRHRDTSVLQGTTERAQAVYTREATKSGLRLRSGACEGATSARWRSSAYY